MAEPSRLTNKVSKMILDVVMTQVHDQLHHTLKAIADEYEIPLEDLIQKHGTPMPLFTNTPAKKEGKKRGRKKKQKEELIETEEYEYNGTTYLVDKDNNVYTNDVNAPVLVGTKLVDGRIKYTDNA
jgi:hypothetical protein